MMIDVIALLRKAPSVRELASECEAEGESVYNQLQVFAKCATIMHAHSPTLLRREPPHGGSLKTIST